MKEERDDSIDAKRYRWLRERGVHFMRGKYAFVTLNDDHTSFGERMLDDVIDAEMKASSEQHV